MPSTYYDLVSRARMETGSFEKGAKRVTTAHNAMQKANRKSGQSMTQVAYALDDLQYGFRGVQNNIQAIAVSAGASGPLVLAITAATVALGYFVQKWEDANRESKKFAQELAQSQGPIAKTLLYAEISKKAAEGTDTHRLALEELKKNGYDPATMSLDGFIRKLKEQAVVEASLAASSGEIGKILAKEVQARQKLAELDKIAGKISVGEDGTLEQTGFLSSYNVRQYNKNLKIIAETPDKVKEITERTAAAVTNALGKDGLAGFILNGEEGKSDLGKGGPGVYLYEWVGKAMDRFKEEVGNNVDGLDEELADAISNLGFAESEEALVNAMDDALGKSFKGLMKNIYKDAFKDQDTNVGEEFTDIFDAITDKATIATAAINGFQRAMDDTNDGGLAAFAVGVIDTLQAVALASAIAAASKDSVKFGAVALPVLIAGALAAVKSAFSGIGKPAGGGGSAARPQINATPAPVNSIQGSGSSTNYIAIRGQDLRYINQAAGDSYLGLN